MIVPALILFAPVSAFVGLVAYAGFDLVRYSRQTTRMSDERATR